MNHMRKMMITAFMLLAGVGLMAQAPTGTQLVPTHEQSVQLSLDLDEAVLAGITLNQAKADYESKMNALTASGAKVIRDNKWPADTEFHYDKKPVYFTPAAPAPTPAPAPKPEDKK